MEITRADLARFGDTLVQCAVVFHKSIAEVLVQQARLICVNLAYNTQPYGLDSAARKKGEAAVIRDLAKVYRSIDTVYSAIRASDGEDTAKAFYGAALNGRLDVAKHILRGCGLDALLGANIGPFDKSIHKSLRDRRGRIRVRSPRQIVTNPKALEEYTALSVSRVGTGKSAWGVCARQLGGVRGIPLWATRNKAAGMVQNLTRDVNNPRIILEAKADYIDTICPPAMQRDALEKQRNKMQTAIRMAADRSVRQSRLAA